MVVKKGYKQTEVGVIPKDWMVRPLCSMLKENPKYGINAAAVKLEGDLPTYIRITDISEDGYYLPVEKVGVDNSFSASYVLVEGDLVFARTGASVGKSYLYNPKDGELVYAGFLIKISPDSRLLLSNYLFQFVKTKIYWNWVKLMSMRSGQPGINGNEYGQLLIPLPPTKTEQTAIANALSDADAWIQSLTRLIDKKRQIKQGAMQTLLNPYENGRLKEGWVDLRFIEIVDKYIDYRGRTPNKIGMAWGGGNILALSANNVQMGKIDIEKEAYYGSEALYKKWMIQGECQKGDVLLTMEAPLGNVAQIPDNKKYILSQRVLLIRPNDKISRDFFEPLHER